MPKLSLFLAVLCGLTAPQAKPFTEVIENRTFTQGLKIENKTDVLIRNCQITNPGGPDGIKIVDCQNVRIEGCVIRRVGNEAMLEKDLNVVKGHVYHPRGLFNLHAIYIHNSNGVSIVGNDITDSLGAGISVTVDIARMDEPVATLIESNRIAFIYADGIDFSVKGGKDGENRENVLGVIIRKNLIHDIGTGLTRLGFARHGMYLSVRDALVEDNTIYNCYYGEGISVRNAAVVRNNKVSNCARACISYWAQGRTANSSQALVIEGNECRQDFALPVPMRHIGNPERLHTLPLGGITIQFSDSPLKVMQRITVRGNTVTMGSDYMMETPVIGGNGDPAKNRARMEVSDNVLIDLRPKPQFFKNLPANVDTAGNQLRAAQK